jgi:hypothetical protein
VTVPYTRLSPAPSCARRWPHGSINDAHRHVVALVGKLDVHAFGQAVERSSKSRTRMRKLHFSPAVSSLASVRFEWGTSFAQP